MWRRCAEWAGIELGSDQIDRMQRYRRWLNEEAVRAGGLGPDEPGRIDRRHIGDSILFAKCLATPELVVDFGSGAGLPGIPLAITLPAVEFLLIDRAGRRVDLLRRAARILDLPNVQVLQGDLDTIPNRPPAIVSRATLVPQDAAARLAPRLGPGGVLVLGGSWVASPAFPGWITIEVPASILDHEVWLLMMRAT
jgi:16S rRNA (guanine527-N7)-methyltransferase